MSRPWGDEDPTMGVDREEEVNTSTGARRVRRHSVSPIPSGGLGSPSNSGRKRVSDGHSYEDRTRARSSTSAPPRRRNSGHVRSGGESADLSALLVEVAVAEAGKNNTSYSPSSPANQQQHQQQQQHQRHDASTLRRTTSSSYSSRSDRARSFSVSGPALASGSSSRSSSYRNSRLLSHERHKRSNTQVTPAADSSGDEGSRSRSNSLWDEGAGQTVIRRHRPERSMPSILDLFGLPPAPPKTNTLPEGLAASLSAEEFAASLTSESSRPGSSQQWTQPAPPQRDAEGLSGSGRRVGLTNLFPAELLSPENQPEKAPPPPPPPLPPPSPQAQESAEEAQRTSRPGSSSSAYPEVPRPGRRTAAHDSSASRESHDTDREEDDGSAALAAVALAAAIARDNRKCSSSSGRNNGQDASGPPGRGGHDQISSSSSSSSSSASRQYSSNGAIPPQDSRREAEAGTGTGTGAATRASGEAGRVPWRAFEHQHQQQDETPSRIAYRSFDGRGVRFGSRLSGIFDDEDDYPDEAEDDFDPKIVAGNGSRNSPLVAMSDSDKSSSSNEDQEHLGQRLAGALRETLKSTLGVSREGGAPFNGVRSGRSHPEGDVHYDIMESGRRRGESETAKTTSQTETPTSICGTPKYRMSGGSAIRSRSVSVTSSFQDSGDFMNRGPGVMRQSSARFQNTAKHVSDQKRGVTTSYKSETIYTQFHKVAIFLVVMGIVIGLGSHGIDTAITQIINLGKRIMRAGGRAAGGGQGALFFFFWLYDVILIGVAALVTAYFIPGVAGSGIPAMKYMMDTDDLANKLKAFSLTAVAVKTSGLVLGASGGLNIGREGPYTHLAGMVSYQLIKNVPYFQDILEQESVLRQVLAASVAVGLSSTFAATIGGVLFSIEITTLHYDVGNYFKAFVAAISGTVAVSLVRTLAEGSPEYIERDFYKTEFRSWQYAVFGVIGILCGILGPLYVNFRLNLLKLARRWGKHAIRTNPDRKWEYVRAATSVACLAATVTAILSFFPGRFTRMTPLATFKELLTEGRLPDYWSSGSINSIYNALAVSTVVWIVTAALGTSVTVPSGDFIQTLVIGATIGRLIGEVMADQLGSSAGVVPSTFALIGAAGLSCGATQTISAAVVVMEMTGSFDLDKPILLTAVVAFGFSRRFGLNIYDSVMALNGLESLYGLDMRRSEEMVAKDIMETNLHVVPCQTTIGELLDLLRGGAGGARMFESYPVVTRREGMAFVGTVSRKDLVHIVLTGGTRTCIDVEYFDYVLQRLPPKDVSASWDRMGEALNVKDLDELFGRLPRSMRQVLGPSASSAAHTVRALKIFTDKIGSLASDMSFMRGGTTFGKGRPFSMRESRDPRDSGKRTEPMSLKMFEALMAGKEVEDNEPPGDPFGERPVDLLKIAQRPSGDVQIDRSVWKAQENMPLKNVYLLFANLRCIRLFVIAGDQLTGIISRSILYHAMSNREIAPMSESSRALERSRGSGVSRTSGGSTPRNPWGVSSRTSKRRWFDLLLGSGRRHGF